MRNPVNPVYFHRFNKRGKSNTAIKSRTSWRKRRVPRLVFAAADVQCARSNPRLRFQVCNATNPVFAGEIYANSEVTRCFARDVHRLASVRLALRRVCARSETTGRETAGEEGQKEEGLTASSLSAWHALGARALEYNGIGADSCDGALDIVPGKPSTFTRKRRPSKLETKPEANSNTKSETKPDAKP